MVTLEQVKANYEKIVEIKDLLNEIEGKHLTALLTYHVGGVEKSLPSEDVDTLIEDYKVLKQQAQDKFKELL